MLRLPFLKLAHKSQKDNIYHEPKISAYCVLNNSCCDFSKFGTSVKCFVSLVLRYTRF